MKKISILLLLFVLGCGYQPIYLNNNMKNMEFYKINISGENEINNNSITIKFLNSGDSQLELQNEDILKIKSLLASEE